MGGQTVWTTLSFNLLLYHCMISVMVPDILVQATHQVDKLRKSNESTQVKSTQEHLEEAFEEQGYYLQRLFLQYGDNGTLTYEGLQELLGSLGLGEVSVLEIRHGGVKHSSQPQSHSHSHEDHHHPQRTTNSPPLKENPHIKSVLGGSPAEWGQSDYFPHPGLRHKLEESVSALSDHPTEKHLHGNCLNVTQLLWNFGLGQASHITPAHFTFLCPALLYQIDSGVCLQHTEEQTQGSKTSEGFLRALGWASLALFVISLPSLVALGLAPLLQPSVLQIFLCPMAGMAVGTLCGDALLHLLPHAIFSQHTEHRDAVFKGLSVLGGLYFLFVFESLLGLKQHFKNLKKRKHDAESGRELDALQGTSSVNQDESSGHGHSHMQTGSGKKGIRSMAWMVVMGDGIHNLTDGLAIGVAFSQSLTGGLSTTIAVFCHELPHELGDLAVLLAAGWPVRRLAVFSLISALLGFVGVFTGTALGNQWATHSPWILTITAGVFLYVALADMMPEMLHGDAGSLSPLKRFLLQSLGLLMGGAIMLCIALFEDHIAVSLGEV
ncbi:zinc transporter ZIP5-like isoform X1 [Carassius auratus]|uniref:Zinc transporter ZIP5-like isoform X1 n=1 Tax=Carassius auratus TaxID=7957 RepID=A0A6P6JD71_CARAU|nr:zinc transporter ZIP5-like isoform X1 [Carassius auratus]